MPSGCDQSVVGSDYLLAYNGWPVRILCSALVVSERRYLGLFDWYANGWIEYEDHLQVSCIFIKEGYISKVVLMAKRVCDLKNEYQF